MNNSLPILNNNGLFYKIRLIFKRIFKNKKSMPKKESVNSCIIAKEEVRENNTFVSSLKNDVIRREHIILNMDKESIISEIESNPDILNSLSINQLKKVDKYYDDIILNYKKKLNIS